MEPMVRAFHRISAIPGASAPHDRVSLTIYYPALFGNTAEERNSGVVPADAKRGPFPVVIMLPGVNLGPEGIGWLAHQLAGAGYVTVAASSISEDMPGYISISPGLLLDHLKPESYGRAPNCSLLQPVIDELHNVQQNSVLAGCLDLDSIALGGHSAGGTAALLNANPEWFPGVRAVFAYAAHSGASMALGWPAETVLNLPAALPTLLLGGDHDGVIAASAHRYGRDEEDPLHTIARTFEEGVPQCDGNSYLMVLKGANHFSFAHPFDGSTGRAFLDWTSEQNPVELRMLLGELIADFLDASMRDDSSARGRLQAALSDERLEVGKSK